MTARIVFDEQSADENYQIENGFENQTDSQISFVDGTRTFTIQPAAANYSFWSGGLKYTKTGADNIVIPDAEGLHFIYFDSTGTLQSTQVFDLEAFIRDNAYVANIYWDAVNNTGIIIADERHGRNMAADTHIHFHQGIGALYVSGLALTNIVADGSGALDTHAQYGVQDGVIRDEDIRHTITDGSPQDISPTAQVPIYYQSGATPVWRKLAANGFAFNNTGSPNGRAWYNQFTGGAWQLTEVSNNNFVLTHIFATGDTINPIIAIMGQAEYNTLPAARDAAQTEIFNLILSTLEDLTAEWRPIATIIGQTSNGYSNTVQSRIRSDGLGNDYVDWRFSGISQVVGGGGAGTDELVKVSSNDTASGYLEEKLVVSAGTNTTDILELTTLNDGGDEDRQLQIDETKIDHDQLLNYVANEHLDWTVDQSPTTINVANLPAHASTHQNGGTDEISVAGLSGVLADGQPVTLEDEGTPVTNTPHVTLNFTGTGVTVSDAGGGEATINVPGAVATDELVKVSANDTTAGYLEDKLVVSQGTNTTNILELTTLNDGADEDRQLQIDETKINHANLLNLTVGDPHTQYQQESEKGAANGYASLDATTRVPTAELATGTANNTTFLRGDRTWAVPDFSKVVFSSFKSGTTNDPSTTADTAGTAPTLAQMTHTFTPASASNKIEVFFSGSFINSKDNGTFIGVFVDGTLQDTTERSEYCGDNEDFPGTLATVWQGTLSVASHTIDIRFWVTNGGTSTNIDIQRSMLIREIDE